MSTHQNDFEKNSPSPELFLGNILDSIPGNVVVIDITEQKKTEQVLSENEEKYRNLISSTNIG